MDKHQIQTLRQSFELVQPIADTAAGPFYSRLLDLDPSLRQLFKNDLKPQGKKLMSSLKPLISGIDNPDQIMPAVRSMGKRLGEHGIQPEHYATVREALLWTLERSLGAAYTPQVEAAWMSAYNHFSRLMQEAASPSTRKSTFECHPGYA